MGHPAPLKKRWIRRATLCAPPVVVVGVWLAMHRIGWLGPLLADGARAIVGPAAVAKLEDYAYAVEDRYNHLVHRHDVPVAYWDVPVPTEIPEPPEPAPS